MAELKIKRGSLLIQIHDRFRGEPDCVFATTLRPGKETTSIERLTIHGWRPSEAKEIEPGVWTLELEPVPPDA